jgi:oligopeptide transport system permease protein
MPSNPTNTRQRVGQQHFIAPLEETPVAPIDKLDESQKARSTWADAWEHMRRRPMFWVSSVMILIILIVAAFPSWFAFYPPNSECFLSNSNGGPQDGHPLGFTRQGCDVYSRIIFGTQSSVTVGLLAAAIVAIFGGIVGALAGFYGGVFDSIVMRVADIFFAIPTVLGAIVLMSVLPIRTSTTVAFVLAVFAWPQIARIMRGSVLSAKNSDYVMASIALGVSKFKILLRHVVPNAIAPVIVIATVSLGTFIVAEATLSFLGVGLPPTVMSWGNDISSARTSLRTEPQVLLYPSFALSLTVLSFLMLGDVVRDALDPEARARR